MMGAVSSASAAPAAPLNHPLKASQVACAESQLARVQRRLGAYGSAINESVTSGDTSLDAKGSLLALSHTTLGGGVFSGLVRLPDLGAGLDPCYDFQNGTEHVPEADLAFDLLFKERSDVLDPHKPRIPQATLVRRDWGTSFGVDHEGCYSYGRIFLDLTCPTILSLDLAAQAQDQLKPQLPIYLNSASAAAPGRTGLGAQPIASATGRGPGILADRLSEACGGTLTDFDQRMFEILARTILPSYYYVPLSPPPVCGATFIYGHTMTIFRGADPHSYRVNIYAYESVCCQYDGGPNEFDNLLQVALEFQMNWDGQGRLTTGTMRVLPFCRGGQELDCSPRGGNMGLFILPPIYPGHGEEPPSAFHNAPYLAVNAVYPVANVLSATINWADILKNTALNSP
jgi:hypothetical protein